jgi:hypothetical protein
MAKKTFYVEIDSAEKLKAFDALLIILGFEKKSPTEYVEKSKVAKKTALSKTPKRPSSTTKIKPVKRTTAKK